eukprot:1333400-Amorphochlora_amoeboformis.AAC.1
MALRFLITIPARHSTPAPRRHRPAVRAKMSSSLFLSTLLKVPGLGVEVWGGVDVVLGVETAYMYFFAHVIVCV